MCFLFQHSIKNYLLRIEQEIELSVATMFNRNSDAGNIKIVFKKEFLSILLKIASH